MKQPGLHVVHAAAVRDAAGTDARPGAVLVRDGVVVAAGEPASLPADAVGQAEAIDRRGCLLLPAMVNAHTHLELSSIGPQPYDQAAGFVGWVQMLRSHWPNDPGPGNLPDPEWFVRGAEVGAALSRESGVQAVGDISRFALLDTTRRAAGLDGVTYLELFGLGPPFNEPALRAISQATQGLQPHAPYSAGPTLYEHAARTGLPISTHLAETRDEAAFVGELTGAKLDFIRSIGRWDDAFAAYYGNKLSPVRWMRPHLEAAADAGGWLAAHCNYVDDEDIKLLADTNTSVAYCPIASEYFGHTGHRYRAMLDAGVNVCLGTDSIVCASPDDPQPLGLLGAMRRLYQRDQTDPGTLLAMATTHGAKALRLDHGYATLKPGAPARLVCIAIDRDDPADPLTQMLCGHAAAQALSFKQTDAQ